MPEVLSGPVDVCVAVPRLAVDRPFTYKLSEEQGAGVGSLVSVPFHGRAVNGWVLGPARNAPGGRILPIKKVRSHVRFFDERMLRLLRWMSERYIAPLATVIERSYPPRIVSEEAAFESPATAPRSRRGPPAIEPEASERGWRRQQAPSRPRASSLGGVLARYGGEELLEPETTTWLRPLPGEEQSVCVDAVSMCLAGGKQALVLVPEADPIPATARAAIEAFGDRAVAFLGGDPRGRYRTWLHILKGRFDVVVGTRPAVLAPLERLGLVWISREVHPGHREDRSPYYHVRDVAMARARMERAACVLASFSPSVETAVLADGGSVRAARPARSEERAAAPLIETAPPEAEDRSPRLTALVRRARSGALIVSRRGYGVARVCRSCGEPAACSVCRGPVVVERGMAVCRVCGADGICGNCGGRSFGVERGGTERVAEWAARTTPAPIRLGDSDGARAPLPERGVVVVCTTAAVKDVGPQALDLVAILDADRAIARAGVHAGEQALATWMEAAAWAGARSAGGRALVHTRHPGHSAVQALIRWEPVPFLLAQARTRTEAGFVPGHAVFRIAGSDALEDALTEVGPSSILSTPGETGTLCLVAVPPEELGRFRQVILRLAGEGTVIRVEAEPQL